MNPSRILPDLQCSLICEDVRQEVNGNFMVNGIISVIRVPKLPVVAWRLFLFNRWTAGVGRFLEAVRLVGPDQSAVLRKGQTQFILENPAQSLTNVTLFTQVQLTTPGIHFVEVLVDDVMKLRYPLPVIIVQPPPAASGTPPAAPGQSASGKPAMPDPRPPEPALPPPPEPEAPQT